MAGASGPVTLAGSLIVHNAEWLSGVVLNQLANKGAPVFLFSSSQIFDLKAVNPNAKDEVDTRTPEELFDVIEEKGKEISEIVTKLRAKS